MGKLIVFTYDMEKDHMTYESTSGSSMDWYVNKKVRQALDRIRKSIEEKSLTVRGTYEAFNANVVWDFMERESIFILSGAVEDEIRSIEKELEDHEHS